MKQTTIRFAIIIALGVLQFVANKSIAQSWPPVPAIDLATLKPSDFTDEEIDLPYYLKHFHTVANSVVETGPTKGFINIAVWRQKEVNQTYNARIMESILSLVYFYTNKRPWNIYYGNTALRTRLEAAMEYWCNMQNPDGRFSEYGPQQWNLAATAFATKFMGEGLVLLKNGPPIDKMLHERVKQADRKAIMATLTLPILYEHGKNFTNQFTNAYAGALAYLSVYPDAEMQRVLHERVKQTAIDFQSPVGFFYEAGGVDFGYNFNTHHSNLWMAYHYSRGTPLANTFIEEEKRFYDWIKYNAVLEPAGYYSVNRGVEMRQKAPVVSSYFLWTSLGEVVEGVRAFNVSKEAQRDSIAKARKNLEANWPNVPELTVGIFSSFSPYAFLHRRHYKWNPADAEKKASIANLPYLKTDRFIHQKMDSRNPLIFTFVRQPDYYASFNSGPQLKPQQRFGLGLLWHPKAGSILQSQTDSDIAAWGTKSSAGKLYEADTLTAAFAINGQPVTPRAGNQNLQNGTLAVTYSLENAGKKIVTFNEQQIEVAIQHAGKFTEHLPFLLTGNDNINIVAPGKVELKKKGESVIISFDAKATPVIKETGVKSGEQRVIVLMIEAADALRYAIAVGR